MQNGDRYVGKVLSMTGTNVLFESEMLGKINVPRKNVASMAFGTNAVAARVSTNVVHITAATPAPLNLSSPAAASAKPAASSTNTDLSAALSNLGGNTDFIREIREKMLAGSPAASAKYDTMVNDLMTGKMDMNGLRRQAADSANQLRQLKKELGPEADESLDGYLKILETFLNQSSAGAKIEAP